jgi:putative hemolysin
MTELAVVSSRKERLRQWAERGDRRSQAALDLATSPNRFLSTVQVGITLVGVLAGAFSGATLAEKLADRLRTMTAIEPYADAIGLGIVVILITYLSVLIGELVPKRLALSKPEGIARIMARPMQVLARVGSPVVRLLSFSTDLVLGLVGFRHHEPSPVTEEEIKLLVREGVRAGVFDRREPEMVEVVLALDRLPVSTIMTPRSKIVMLNRDDPHATIWHKIVVCSHSSFPVYDGDRDRIIGIVAVKSIYANLAAGVPVKITDLMTEPLMVPESQTVTQLLDVFKKTGKHIALVTNASGETIGLVTLIDVMEAIVGDIPTMDEKLKPVIRKRADGTWLVDGAIELAAMEGVLAGFQARSPRDTTLAALAQSTLDRVPKEGDVFEEQGYRFEVIDMDRQRVDKVLVMPAGTDIWKR